MTALKRRYSDPKKWPRDHHPEHVANAEKGWATRRGLSARDNAVYKQQKKESLYEIKQLQQQRKGTRDGERQAINKQIKERRVGISHALFDSQRYTRATQRAEETMERQRKEEQEERQRGVPRHEPSVSSFAEAGFIQVKGAKAEKGDTYTFTASQRADGRWIVTRKYKSGLVVQEKGTWAQNPLIAKSNRRDAEYNLAHPGGGLFGGEHERKANGIKGLFD